MKQNCSYTYIGQVYSKDRLTRKIASELPVIDQTESIRWLEDHFDMSNHEVTIVTGLIDGKSLGRFVDDAHTLLSDRASLNIAKHEGFHRVWRTYLTPEERTSVIKEFKRKTKNWESVIEPYKKLTNKTSEADVIEEYFAYQFEDYNLQPSSYKTFQPLQSYFNRLYNFLRKVLGLKPLDIQQVYDKILNKNYKTAKSLSQYPGSADAVFIENVPFSIAARNEITNYLTQQFVANVINSKAGVEGFIDGSASEKMPILINILQGQIGKSGLSEEMFQAVDDDLEKGKTKIGDSEFLSRVVDNLKLLGLEIEDVPLDENEKEIGESKAAREFTANIKINPKTGLTGKIKILLSSFQHPTKITESGVPEAISWGQAFNQITSKMVNIPTEYFKEELLNSNIIVKDQLAKFLGWNGSEWDNSNIQFRNEFISKMSLTENRFLMLLFGEDSGTGKKDIYLSDLNSETRTANVLKRWRTNLDYKLNEWSGDTNPVDAYKRLGAELASTKTLSNSAERVNKVLDILGIQVNEEVKPKIVDYVNHMINASVKSVSDEKFAPSAGVYDNLTIAGTVKKIAELESVFEEQVDTMINVNGTNVYSMGLNTQQTIISNKIKYLVNKGKTQGLEGTDLIEYLKVEMPEVFNEWNLTWNGEQYEINKLLVKYLTSGVQLSIPYVAKNEREDTEDVDKLNEPDLAMLHIHGALKGQYLSLKHSDRSTFFAYDLGTPLFTSNQFDTEAKGVEHIRLALIKEIETEIKFARDKYQHQPMQYITGEKLGYAALLGGDRFAELVNGSEINESDKSILTKAIESEFNAFVNDVEMFGLFQRNVTQTDNATGNDVVISFGHTAGLSEAELKKYQPNAKIGIKVGKHDLADIRLMLMAAFTNESVFHMQESRLFSGDNRVFKNVSDLYKRLAAQSSNGLLAVTDDTTNAYIKEQLNRDYDIFDITTGNTISINTTDFLEDKHFRAVTLKENSSYQARNLDLATDETGRPLISKLGIENPTILAMGMEYGFLADEPNPNAKQKDWMLKKIKSAEEAYAGINENDGLSYMTLPAFKNYMTRFGTWTDEMEVSYQIEMELLKYKNLQDAKDMQITIKGTKKYDNVTFKPFDLSASEFKTRQVGDREVSLEALHTLKTQYSGNNVQESMYRKAELGGEAIKYSFLALFKTSQHLMQPSAIMGTNLQAMNVSMLKNNIQIVHMGSANKVGGIDPSEAASQIKNNPNDSRNTDERIDRIINQGLEFYGDNGAFNSDLFDLSANPETGFANYLADWAYLKDQVKVGSKEKSEIINSTQSLKILMTNLLINGEERFPGALKIVEQYKGLIRDIIRNNTDEFFKELGWDGTAFKDMSQVRNVVLSSSQIQNSPENIKNEVINFFDSPEAGIETLTFRAKIENVLYALVTKNIIDFKRPGNSYPQAASTGYEAYGTRELLGRDSKGNPIFKSTELDFYKPVFDSEGNVIKVLPAEIIIPLPTKWIPQLMKASGKTNLIDAIDWLNNQSDLDKKSGGSRFIVKGLRIPNQQLSSNDIFRVKRFTLPTVQNYAVTPSEIVVKVGSDYDLDKINIYWGDIQNRLFSKPTNSNEDQLVNMEEQILLHPRNIQHLLMPLGKEIFVDELYTKEFVEGGFIAKDTDTMFSILNPMTNVKKAIIFVKGKQAVGIGAKSITFYPLNQTNNNGASILDDYIVGYEKGQPVYETTGLRFEGLDGEGRYFGNYADTEGNMISQNMGELLTLYVDGVKEPVAVLMNITMQTANVVDYLMKAGLSAKQITFFLSQPLIKDYLLAQKVNESLFIKNIMVSSTDRFGNTVWKSREKGKNDLIAELLGSINSPLEIEAPADWKIQDLKSSLVKAGQKPNYSNEQYRDNQVYLLQHYLKITELSKVYGHFIATQDSDTKTFASINDVLLDQEMRGIVNSEYIVSQDTVDRFDVDGLVAPFYQYGRKSYQALYGNMYKYSLNSKFSPYINQAKFLLAKEEKGEKKERVMQAIENDFMLFLAHNFYFTQQDSDRLLKGKESVAKRVKELKIKIPSNIVLKAFQPMIGVNSDPLNGESIDNLRLYEKNLESNDANDLAQSLQEIYDIDPILYKDIVHLLYFQNGYNPGILNYFKIIPVGINQMSNADNTYQYLTQEVQSVVVRETSKLNDSQVEDMFTKFMMLFDLNNSQFIKKQQKSHLVRKTYDTSKERIRFYHTPHKGKAMELKLLGNKAMKRYNLSYFPALPKTVEKPQGKTNAVIEQQVIQNTFVAKNQQQTDAINAILDFVKNGNPREYFTLEGKAGTGKTTLVQEVIRQLQGKEIVVSALSHKAKKVLRDKLKAAGMNTKAVSVASLLGIKMDMDTGKFESDPFILKSIDFADIVFIDESSMISEELLDEIMKLKRRDAKIIFLGDIGQLPPIRKINSDKPSPTFKTKNKAKLTERVRQGEESPILPFADLYWDNSQASNPVTNPAPFSNRKNKITSKGNLLFEKNILDVVDDYKQMFIRAKETGDSNLIKIVTYKNDKRRLLNERVRRLIFDNPSEYEKGEIIIFNNNYDVDSIPIENAEEFAVTDVRPNTFRLNWGEFKGYYLQSVTENGNLINYPVLRKEEQSKYNDVVSQLFNEAKKIKGSPEYKSALRYAWDAKNYFAEIDYAYAITSHKAQGSTYNTTIVDESDILSVGPTSNQSKSQSIYTAITRSSDTTVMVNQNNPDQDLSIADKKNIIDTSLLNTIIKPKVQSSSIKESTIKPVQKASTEKPVVLTEADKNYNFIGEKVWTTFSENGFKGEVVNYEPSINGWNQKTLQLKVQTTTGKIYSINYDPASLSGYQFESSFKEEYRRYRDATNPANTGTIGKEVLGINISTRSEDALGRALTNPTWGSKKDGKNYFDVETKYKARKFKSDDPTVALNEDMRTMFGLIKEKLRLHPELVTQITERGGLEFLQKSSHTVGVKGSRWEGVGMESNFIKVLAEAYTVVSQEGQQKSLFNTGSSGKGSSILNKGYTNIQQYLDDIIEQEHTLSPLARKLKSFRPNNAVLITENIKVEVATPLSGQQGLTAMGQYNPNTREIKINPNAEKTEVHLLHEYIHAITFDYIRENPNSQAVKDLKDILEVVRKNQNKLTDKYPIENLDEFITGIFTRSRFINDLTQIEYKGKSVVTKLLEWFSSLFRLTPKQQTLFEEVFYRAENLLNEIQQVESGIGFDTLGEEDIQDSIEDQIEEARLRIFNKYGQKYGRQTTEINQYADWGKLTSEIAKVNREFGRVLELYQAPNGKWYLRRNNEGSISIPEVVKQSDIASNNSTEFNIPLGQMGQELVDKWSEYFTGYDDLTLNDRMEFAKLMEAGLLEISCKI